MHEDEAYDVDQVRRTDPSADPIVEPQAGLPIEVRVKEG